MNYLILLTVPVLLALGQISFKLVATAVGAQTSVVGYIHAVLTTPIFYVALLIYSASTLFWIFALTKFPLTVAYPFVALAFVIVPVLSLLFLKESIDLRLVFGSALIICGVVVISFGRIA